MSYYHSPRSVTSGLIFYVDAINPKSYPGSGTTWYDLVHNAGNFTASNTSTLTYVSSAGSFRFINNVNYTDYFIQNLNSTNTLQTPQYYSAEGFFTASVSPSGNTTYSLIRVGTGTDEVFMFMLNLNTVSKTITSFSAQWYNAGFRGDTSATISVPFDTWCHGVITNNNGYYSYYLNGKLISTTDLTGQGSLAYANVSATQVKIGGSGSNAQDYSGQIAMVKVYNRALTAPEVAQNYNALKARYGLT